VATPVNSRKAFMLPGWLLNTVVHRVLAHNELALQGTTSSTVRKLNVNPGGKPRLRRDKGAT